MFTTSVPEVLGATKEASGNVSGVQAGGFRV